MYLRIAAYMTVAAVVAKLVLFLLNLAQENMAMFTIFINILVVLIGSFFTVRRFKMKNLGSEMKDDVKAGMKTTTLFALFMSVFVFIYYQYIDTHYFPQLIEERVALAQESLAENPDIQVDQVREMGEVWFNPRTHSTITLFGLTITGAIYTFLVALLMRKLPGFR